jgi:hypothetical protein
MKNLIAFLLLLPITAISQDWNPYSFYKNYEDRAGLSVETAFDTALLKYNTAKKVPTVFAYPIITTLTEKIEITSLRDSLKGRGWNMAEALYAAQAVLKSDTLLAGDYNLFVVDEGSKTYTLFVGYDRKIGKWVMKGIDPDQGAEIARTSNLKIMVKPGAKIFTKG